MATDGITMDGTKHKNADGTWTMKLHVCNKNDKPVDIKLSDNPWKTTGIGGADGVKQYDYPRKEGEKVDIKGSKKRRELALEHWVNPKTKDNAPLTLGKSGSGTDCYDFEFTYTFEPSSSYCDAFVMKPDGTPEDMWSGQFTHDWDKIATVIYYRDQPGPTRLCAFYLPYQMSLQAIYNGPVSIVIDRVTGLPDSHRMVTIFPPIGVPHQLECADRRSEGAMIIRQVAPAQGTHRIGVVYRVVDPPHLRHWPERTITFDLVGSADYFYHARNDG